MTTSVLCGALLLATLFLGRQPLSAQQPTPTQLPTQFKDLPDAPQPSAELAMQEPAPGNPAPADRSAEGAIGHGQKGANPPGFPPVSRPASGRTPVPEGSRRSIPDTRPACQPDSSSPAERVMSCQPNIPIFARFLNSCSSAATHPKAKVHSGSQKCKRPLQPADHCLGLGVQRRQRLP